MSLTKLKWTFLPWRCLLWAARAITANNQTDEYLHHSDVSTVSAAGPRAANQGAVFTVSANQSSVWVSQDQCPPMVAQ